MSRSRIAASHSGATPSFNVTIVTIVTMAVPPQRLGSFGERSDLGSPGILVQRGRQGLEAPRGMSLAHGARGEARARSVIACSPCSSRGCPPHRPTFVAALAEGCVSTLGILAFLAIAAAGVKVDLVLLPSLWLGAFPAAAR